MSATGSPFCEHKKLRTGCAACRAAGVPAADRGLAATPFRSRDDDAPAPRSRRAKAGSAAPQVTSKDAPPKLGGIRADGAEKPRPSGRGGPRADGAEKPWPSGRGGPAKPLMPTRARKKPVSAAEAERAQAWWVKK